MKSSVRTIAIFLLLVIVSGFVGSFLGSQLRNSPLADQLKKPSVLEILLMLGSILPIIAVHELGHLAGARLLGMKFLLFVVGPFQVTQTRNGLRFNLVWKLGNFGGLVAALPNQQHSIRPQLLSLIAGGPLASLLLAVAGLALFAWKTSPSPLLAGFVGFLSAVTFLVTIIPMKIGGFMTDGMQLIEIWRGGLAMIFRQKIMVLTSQSMAGIRPREWDSQIIADVMQETGTVPPLYRVAAHSLALFSAIDRQKWEEADRLAKWMEGNVKAYPVGFRQALTLELCLHAIRKGDLTTARRWHDESKGGIVDKSRRSLVNAELALAEGRMEEARALIQSARDQLRHAMDAGVCMMTSDDLNHLEFRISNLPI